MTVKKRKGLTTKEALIARALSTARYVCEVSWQAAHVQKVAEEISFELQQDDPRHNREVFLSRSLGPF